MASLLVMLAIAWHAAPSRAVTVPFTLDLAPANSQQNTLSVRLSADHPLVGSDNDTTQLSGTMTGLLDIDLSTGMPVPIGLTFQGGLVTATDMSFGLAGGLLSATTTNVAGSTLTASPPGGIVDNMFDAAQHSLVLNQGMVAATGVSVNFADEPLIADGLGTGTLTLTPFGPPMETSQQYDVMLNLPLEVAASFVAEGVPILGDVTIDVDATGTIVASQRITLEFMEGDYTGDGILDCNDLELLVSQVDNGPGDLLFDADQNGVVATDDILYWVQTIRGTLVGDANVDGYVDNLDLAAWSDYRFTEDLSWCHGDFNVDGIIDGEDFNLWNAHKGLTAAAATAAVPEPRAAVLALVAMLPFTLKRRKPCHSA